MRFSSIVYSLKFLERRNTSKRRKYLGVGLDQTMIQNLVKLVRLRNAFGGEKLLSESSFDSFDPEP